MTLIITHFSTDFDFNNANSIVDCCFINNISFPVKAINFNKLLTLVEISIENIICGI